MSEHKKTVFLDIDGCVLKHQGNLTNIILNEAEALPGVVDKFNEWEALGYKIVLTTGRKECTRDITNKQLQSLGLFYHELIMECHRGQRVLINDIKPGTDEVMAVAINLQRDEGLGGVHV